jgi:hypothetical protein
MNFDAATPSGLHLEKIADAGNPRLRPSASTNPGAA